MISRKEFLLSIRESGYKGVEWALAELIDNSIEARATVIRIDLPEPTHPENCDRICVSDNGNGMDRDEARIAMLLGGSTRFGSRAGVGRFGMGLPCSSLSQARRFEVISKRTGSALAAHSFDIDEELVGRRQPRVLRCNAVDHQDSGTVVIWRKLDKLRGASWGRKAGHLRRFIGRKYRQHLSAGVRIMVDGADCSAFDPLLCQNVGTPGVFLASPWESPLAIPVGDASLPPVEVRFSLLNVHGFAGFSAEEKRRLGIIGRAGVSIVRAGREIDYGWFFIDRRRENYDDWWRAELSFDPRLDELFGVSYTKQGIRPTDGLRALLSPHITEASRSLQRAVRCAHAALAPAEFATPRKACAQAERNGSFLQSQAADQTRGTHRFRLKTTDSTSIDFLQVEYLDGALVTTINRNHIFYDRLVMPLSKGHLSDNQVAVRLHLLLLAFARTLANRLPEETDAFKTFLSDFSRNIKHFLRDAQ